jgi:hypothetical protein
MESPMTPRFSALLLATFVSRSVSPDAPPRVSFILAAKIDTATGFGARETLGFGDILSRRRPYPAGY